MSQYAQEKTIVLSDETVRKDYLDYTYSDVRMGKVLEDLDLLAGAIAMEYAQGPAVTAALARLDLIYPIDVLSDLVLKADLNAVGKSSLELGARLESGGHYVASAYFTFVALTEDLTKIKSLPPYEPQTETEIRRRDEALARKKDYLQSQSQPLTEANPLGAEQLLTVLRSTEARPMSSGYNLEEMQPQNTNILGKVFGGYLMRTAYELAHATVREYSGGIRPILASIDRINFLQPVKIGSLMRFHRTISYVGHSSVNVRIAIDDAEGKQVTNDCYFTFVGMDANFKPVEMPKVRPTTPEETLIFLAGHQRYLENKARIKKE